MVRRRRTFKKMVGPAWGCVRPFWTNRSKPRPVFTRGSRNLHPQLIPVSAHGPTAIFIGGQIRRVLKVHAHRHAGTILHLNVRRSRATSSYPNGVTYDSLG
ncbi:hypothetical protein APED_04025 [Acanthopleuribacter pedis]